MADTPKIVCVVPTIRPERMEEFRKVWGLLFKKHAVTLVTVWDGERPTYSVDGFADGWGESGDCAKMVDGKTDLFCRFTDAVRNYGFVAAAQLKADVVLTLDDDVVPCNHINRWVDGSDPIQAHLDALNKRVPISWMNTAHDTDLYLRGVPYGVRDEAPVMMSHGVWVGTPDFDGETQLKLETCPKCGGEGRRFVSDPSVGLVNSAAEETCTPCCGTGKVPNGVPYSLPYFVGPVPKGVLFPMCGMNLAVKRDALPYLYFAPMGPDSGVVTTREVDQTAGGTHTIKSYPLNRFADIWCGVFLKREFDRLGWACYTGASTVMHTRASDAKKNFEQEKLGREWNEWMCDDRKDCATLMGGEYYHRYRSKRERYMALVSNILTARGGK